jgi:hypothetical protein
MSALPEPQSADGAAPDELTLTTEAKLTGRFWFNGRYGKLSYAHGRLSFTANVRHALDFDLMLKELDDVWVPWWMMSSGFRFRHGKAKYSVNFNNCSPNGLDTFEQLTSHGVSPQLGVTGAELSDMAAALELGVAWRTLLGAELGRDI